MPPEAVHTTLVVAPMPGLPLRAVAEVAVGPELRHHTTPVQVVEWNRSLVAAESVRKAQGPSHGLPEAGQKPKAFGTA